MHCYDLLPSLSTTSFTPHALHGSQSTWLEKNCYVDLFIEIVHAFNMQPLAMLPFTLAVDFAGDQWTFFKPSLSEMRDLYGIDVQELSLWRSVLDHSIEHLAAGRSVSIEVDAFWLPDTAATDYRQHHSKTTIAIIKLDVANQRLGYFHNAGYYELNGNDFRQIFRIGITSADDYLFPYAELIHLDRIIEHPQQKLLDISYDLLCKYIRLRPNHNPIQRYADRFIHDLPLLQERGLGYYHLWAFNNTRQLGAAFELAAAYLKWLTHQGIADFSASILAFEKISTDNKALILKVARAVNSKKPLDLYNVYNTMADDWAQGMYDLVNQLESH